MPWQNMPGEDVYNQYYMKYNLQLTAYSIDYIKIKVFIFIFCGTSVAGLKRDEDSFYHIFVNV